MVQLLGSIIDRGETFVGSLSELATFKGADKRNLLIVAHGAGGNELHRVTFLKVQGQKLTARRLSQFVLRYMPDVASIELIVCASGARRLHGLQSSLAQDLASYLRARSIGVKAPFGLISIKDLSSGSRYLPVYGMTRPYTPLKPGSGWSFVEGQQGLSLIMWRLFGI